MGYAATRIAQWSMPGDTCSINMCQLNQCLPPTPIPPFFPTGVARIVGYAATRVTLRFPAPTTSSSQHAPNITPVASASNLSAAALPSAPEPEPAGPGTASTAGTTGKAAAVQTAPASAAPAEGAHQEHVKELSRGAGLGAAAEVKKAAKKSKRPEVMELTAPILNLTAGNSRQLASMVQVGLPRGWELRVLKRFFLHVSICVCARAV